MVKEHDEGENQPANAQPNGLLTGRCIQEASHADLPVLLVAYGEDHHPITASPRNRQKVSQSMRPNIITLSGLP